MQEPLVSIVVPIYKVEDYLHRCVDSILSQEHKNLEIILVNDGSPDNSGAIIDEYYAKYPDLIVPVHQENQGAGAARNNGFALAKGEWVSFIDSDDYIEPDYVSTMLQLAEEKDADIVVSNMYVENSLGLRVRYPMLLGKKLVKGIQAAKSSLNLISIPNFAVNKLYRVSLLRDNDFKFPAIYFEDVAIAAKTLFNAGKVAITYKPLYHYVMRDDSQVGSFNKEKLDEAFEAIEMVGDFLQSKGMLKEWSGSWKRFLATCQTQFTTQIIVQMGGEERGARREALKYLNARMKSIERKYSVDK